MWLLFFVVMTMISKESFEVYFVFSLVVLFKANRFKKSFVSDFSHVEGAVDTAEVDEIESASAHNEHRLKIVEIGCGNEIVNKSAVACDLELRDTRKATVNGRLVCESVGIIGYSALQAQLLLCEL